MAWVEQIGPHGWRVRYHTAGGCSSVSAPSTWRRHRRGPGRTGRADPRSCGRNVYDKSGRVVASWSGSGALTAYDWTCTSYDACGRMTQVRYPAYTGQPARTVTNNYLVDPDGSGPRTASPLVSTTAVPVGTITTETDLFVRVISYRDVFGNTTTLTYDLAGRELSSNSPQIGQIVKAYDNADRLTADARRYAARRAE